MTEYAKMAEQMMAGVQDYVRRCFEPLGERFKSIEKRIADIPSPQRGEKGEAGINGRDGVDGTKGIDGEKGEKGDAGERGEPGQPGDRGEPGEPGARGEPGEKGEPGQNGKDGAPGQDGLKGEPGEIGAQGPIGEKGEKGEPGLNGKDGAPGQDGQKGGDGAFGERGEKGLDGTNGIDGRDGQEGIPGRDALQIDVLDVIDVSKRYQRGTYAHHRGGIVRSFKATEPLGDDFERSGWHVVVRGIDTCDLVASDDFRTMSLRMTLTDGRVQEKTVEVPAMLYRGIWKAGEYQRGDVVTRDGCSWHANLDTSGTPGASEDWQMCVKKGRDGRDGLAGAKGDTGADGRPGKDLVQMGFDGRKY